nr:NUDIX hydrolase [Anaerolineae bacterium]
MRQDRVQFPDGSEGPYTVIVKPDSVFVVPITTDNKMVLIRNYRYTLGKWLWEVPAGGVKLGHTPEEAACQELAEEVGGVAGLLREVATYYTMPGVGTEQAHVFLAQDVRLGQPQLESGELIECHQFPVDDAIKMALNNQITDGLSALSILLCTPHLEK